MAKLALHASSRIEELSRIQDAASNFLAGHRVQADSVFAVQFAIEELFSNIVRYGYDESKEQQTHVVEIRLALDREKIAVTIEDDGHTFDPLSHPVPDTTLPIDQRPIGGLGLFLTQRLASSVEYRRVAGKNQLTVRFPR